MRNVSKQCDSEAEKGVRDGDVSERRASPILQTSQGLHSHAHDSLASSPCPPQAASDSSKLFRAAACGEAENLLGSASRSAHESGSAARIGLCRACNYWDIRGYDPEFGNIGWCGLFQKLTPASHGSKCTGWTEKEKAADARPAVGEQADARNNDSATASRILK